MLTPSRSGLLFLVASVAVAIAAALEVSEDGTTPLTVLLWAIGGASAVAAGAVRRDVRGAGVLSTALLAGLVVAEVAVRVVDPEAVADTPASPITVGLALPVVWLLYGVGAWGIRGRPRLGRVTRRADGVSGTPRDVP